MMQGNGTCRLLCVEHVPPEDAKFINDRIREDYAINWLVDGLPAAEMKEDKRTKEVFFDMGFNLGNDEGEFEEMPALHNHYDIVLRSVRDRDRGTSFSYEVRRVGTTHQEMMSFVSSEFSSGLPGNVRWPDTLHGNN